jgi:hypothetical protein
MQSNDPEQLAIALRSATLTLNYATATAHLTATLHRLAQQWKYGFDPNQPRILIGLPGAGRWTHIGAAGSPPADRVHIAENRDPSFYTVDLEDEDRFRGGHGYRRHVSRSDASLIAELIAGDKSTRFDPRAGTFLSAGDANFYATQVLRAHPEVVEAIVAGGPPKTIIQRFGYQTGKEAYRDNETSPILIRPTYAVAVIIAHDDRRNGRGYRIITAFPMNDLPDETLKDQ